MEETRKYPALSEREQQLISLATVGLTDAAIAIRLGISEPTVRSYWGRVRIKIGPYNRTELVAIALKEETRTTVTDLMERIKVLEAQVYANVDRVIELHEELLENAPEAVFATDERGNIVWVNQEAVRMFGYTSAELAGQHVNMLIPKDLDEIHSKHMAEYFAAPVRKIMGEHLRTIGQRKSGEIFATAASLMALISDDRRIYSVFMREIPVSQALDNFMKTHGKRVRSPVK